MAGILGGQLFPEKNMAEVRAAISALDFRANAVGVGQALYRSRYFIVKARPAAMGFKLVF